jgi:hypothetical protein
MAMATVATFFRRSDYVEAEREIERESSDPYRLRSLPADSVFFFSKRIDNSRLVREAEPKTRTDCWSAIATACVLAVMVGTAVSPRVGGVLAGMQVEKLRAEQRELLDQRRLIEIQEARILNSTNLDEMAAKNKLAAPAPGQEQHLQPRDSSLALNSAPSVVNAQ